ncbi:dihydroneopterin aldolase [Tenuibacillus multivorans]|uniref:7,8-dihydroneopterin aldolase n=1 Tax=Tenuibacillus multivorans TaxID=237069 RepID=A0A1G9VYA3_9BACI|nr:dihydroneopterin aldolase [Tenuibacillus multivorans]GEL78237.1 7,8-dihydroneopterin aldolase [Tenuibacillus multivorans]SDM76896.1 dihydroneopterin aldolase [Tenuibacillus multivorans]
MDKILLNDMMFYGYHGLYPEENKLGQRFTVDLQLLTDLKKAGHTDDMNDSIHYGHVYKVVGQVVEGEAKNLIETVAEDIAKRLFTTFEALHGVIIKVNKPGPPIPGYYESVAVEIERERKDYE